MVIRHIRRHVCLIVVQIDRSRTRVIGRIVVVIIRRTPYGIRCATIDIPHRRTFHEHRTDNIVISVQIPVAHHLHIQRAGSALRYQRGYVLEHTRGYTRLNKQGMIVPAVGLYHTQVVDPSVAVQIQVVDHIPAGIQKLLKLPYRTALGKSRSYGVQIQIERRIAVIIIHGHRRHCRMLGCRSRYGGRIDCPHRSYRLYCGSDRKNTCPAPCHNKGQRYQVQRTKDLSHFHI